ncbi:unnamed protein product [Laminaria digitata]
MKNRNGGVPDLVLRLLSSGALFPTQSQALRIMKVQPGEKFRGLGSFIQITYITTIHSIPAMVLGTGEHPGGASLFFGLITPSEIQTTRRPAPQAKDPGVCRFS